MSSIKPVGKVRKEATTDMLVYDNSGETDFVDESKGEISFVDEEQERDLLSKRLKLNNENDLF